MMAMQTLPDLLRRTHEVDGQQVVYRFANGLTIKTEVFNKNDRLRILPLGSPQCSLLNYLLGFPEVVHGKRVFEPFAGSGALGLMALKAGAAHVELLDINPRAMEFHRENIALSGLSASQVTSITGDVAAFTPQQRYDLVLANPPFIPTPDGIQGTITSNGGPEGSRFVEILVDRIEEFLEPTGRALICVLQFEKDRQPLILDLLGRSLKQRPVELTPAQEHAIPFETYCWAYRQLFPRDIAAIDRWEADLVGRHGAQLTVSHYVIEIGPSANESTRCVIRDNFAEKFGSSFLVPSADAPELAMGRVFENYTAAIEAAERSETQDASR
jgi:hypothetical protein